MRFPLVLALVLFSCFFVLAQTSTPPAANPSPPQANTAQSTAPPASPPADKPPPPADQQTADQAEPAPPPGPCEGKSADECGVSPEEFKKAAAAFKRGESLKKQEQFEPALQAFNEAAWLVPRDVQFVTERELMRQQLAFEHIQRGNDLFLEKRTVEAAAELRKALGLDSGNQFALDRLREIADQTAPPPHSFISQSDDQPILPPLAQTKKSFKLNGNTRDAFTQAAQAFGVRITFDDSTPSRNVKLNLDQVTAAQAFDAIAFISHCFWTVRDWGEVFIASDTQANRKEYERYLLRTFYLPDVESAQEMNDIVNALRIVFEMRLVQSSPANNSITVRGPESQVEAATRFLQSFWVGRPQVMLDLEIFAVNRQMMRALGLNLPLQFNAFNIPAAAIAALGNTNVQQLLNQLIAGGGLNGANASSSISALLAQLQQQQSQLSSLFQSPVATFGGGATLFGVGIPAATANLSVNESRITTLQQVTLHAAQGNAATFRLGTRYPVLNAQYSSAVNVPSQIAGLLGASGANNTNALATYPSFSYEDLGITLKAKPTIHNDVDVTLDMELEIRALAGASVNGVPILSNQSYKGVVTVKNGEPAVLAGEITKSEQATLTGIPGIHSIPVLGTLTNNRTKQTDDEELLMVLTPRITNAGPERSGPGIPVPKTQ